MEKAGLVAVGIGARAGDREIGHLSALTDAKALVTVASLAGRSAHDLLVAAKAAGAHSLEHLIVVSDDEMHTGWPIREDGEPARPTQGVPELRWLGPDDLFLLNSTSGTTGLPKCVMHTQNRWNYFHQLAQAAGELRASDVFMSLVPAPFGFGLWTSHFSPLLLGAPAVLMERFDADAALDFIEAEQATVLCCVSTQFIMMLNAQAERPRELSSLRCMFTGGEAVPYERAAEFDRVTGAAVLQFYGSNETGALSGTNMTDSRERRLRTAGGLIPEMNVKLFDPEDLRELAGASRGQPGCRGPATSLGYWGDENANKKLFTPDGWMLMGDIVEVDDAQYVKVVARTSDFIIRGGKNISAPAVEDEVSSHPDIALAAVVAVPDPIFGERVAVFVIPRGTSEPSFDSLIHHLTQRGVTREWFPEYFAVVPELPRSSGGKVSKAELREDALRRWGPDR